MLKHLQSFNDLLALLYLPFILCWVIGVIALTKWVGLTIMEAFGLGTATGVLLAILKDIYQFYFRRAPEKKES